MSQEQKTPSVIRFEQAVKAKQYESACNELLDILSQIDSNFGGINGIEFNCPEQLNNPNLSKEKTIYFSTRMADLITELFSDESLSLTVGGAVRFFSYQRWIALLFACSPYINSDHILQVYNRNPDKSNPNSVHLSANPNDLVKFCIMYLPESNISLNLDAIWQLNPTLCASMCFALQSPRFIGTKEAFGKRGAILQWFPEKLAQLPNLDNLPSSISHDVYMHCSYDVAANKHDVKRALNQVMRRHLVTSGWVDRDISKIGKTNSKPVMVVLLEHFHSAHSIYRTHSTSMRAAREHFHLIGIGGSAVDKAGQEVFDDFRLVEGNTIFEKLSFVKRLCEEYGAAIFYMPSIGMDLTTIFASNTRLAPIQAIALGHPGTTHSEFIEYVVVEDDYVGSEACFSEKLLRLPKDALPYVPSALAPASVEYRLRENPEVVNIGIASTTMKLNPYFLDALKAIRDRAKVKVHFHFALGQSSGITHPYVERFIKSHLGDSATAHPHSPYHQYMQILHNCDMLVNPFPFGNTNGIIDMVTLGLVGICKTGPEVHEHIDEGLFKRLGLPEWLIANTVDEYVERAVRLAENHAERLALRRHIIENNGLQTLFTGDPKPMGQVFVQKLNEWAGLHNIDVSDFAFAQSSGKKVTKSAKTAAKKTVKVTVKKSAQPKESTKTKSKTEKKKTSSAKDAAKTSKKKA
ncbi:hypothetical protein EDC51_104111 [Bibersteinia trehalosi]|uniref:UDP-glucose:protein N-beta-glucosyltransferase n=1 Tax=Bibersteinia trehalosi TaxID=47735 RepID=UPI001042BC1A|nr:adhesin [Bibersteinia trehalosi]TCT16559.1 hypothetical protein EDC51_104111 [Bibersteinia trehalosi]